MSSLQKARQSLGSSDLMVKGRCLLCDDEKTEYYGLCMMANELYPEEGLITLCQRRLPVDSEIGLRRECPGKVMVLYSTLNPALKQFVQVNAALLKHRAEARIALKFDMKKKCQRQYYAKNHLKPIDTDCFLSLNPNE